MPGLAGRAQSAAAAAAVAVLLAACGGDGGGSADDGGDPAGFASPAESRDPQRAAQQLLSLGHQVEWIVVRREAAGAPPTSVLVPQPPPGTCVVAVTTHDGRSVSPQSPPTELHVQVADAATARALGRAC